MFSVGRDSRLRVLCVVGIASAVVDASLTVGPMLVGCAGLCLSVSIASD